MKSRVRAELARPENSMQRRGTFIFGAKIAPMFAPDTTSGKRKGKKKMRLIDADALNEKLEALMQRYTAQGRKEVAEDYNFVMTVLMTAPTIDAVPVVRCRDCVHMERRFNGRFCKVWCMFNGMGDDGFCNYAARKDGTNDE